MDNKSFIFINRSTTATKPSSDILNLFELPKKFLKKEYHYILSVFSQVKENILLYALGFQILDAETGQAVLFEMMDATQEEKEEMLFFLSFPTWFFPKTERDVLWFEGEVKENELEQIVTNWITSTLKVNG